MVRSRLLAAGAFALLAVFGLSGAAFRAAAATSPDDAFSQLQSDHSVTGATEHPQPLWETPSSASVITAAEIRAHGYRTLAEALEWLRGIYTRYDRNYTFVGVRGMQRPGDYNNKVLLTIDGHTMNSPIYGDAAFGSELGLDLESVERIELTRGPGSSLYGGNAVLATVNVVTRGAAALPGVQADVRAGGQDEERGFVSFASTRPDLPALTLSGSWDEARGADLFFREYQDGAPGSGVARRADGETARNVLGTLQWRQTRLEVKVNERLKHIPTGAFGTTFGDDRTRTSDGHDFVELSTSGQPSGALELSGRTYWDASRYWGDYVYGPDSSTYLNHDVGYSDLFGSELRANWRPGRANVVTAGTEGRWVYRALQQNFNLLPGAPVFSSDAKSSQSSVYAQDEVELTHRAHVTAGARFDAYSRYGNVVSPRFDLVCPLGNSTTWKLLAGSAYRAPTPYETQYASSDQIPNPDLLPERLTTLETVFERWAGPGSYTFSVHQNWIRDLIDPVTVDTSGTFVFRNRGHVRSLGASAEVQLQLFEGSRVRADVSWQSSHDVETGRDLTDSPHWLGHFVLTHAPQAAPFSFGFGMRWLASRLTLAQTRLPSVAVADLRADYFHRGLDLGIEFHNLFDERYSDPGALEHLQDAIPQDGRGVFVTFAYRKPTGS